MAQKKMSSGTKKTAAKKKAQKKRNRILLFVLEIVVLIILLLVVYAIWNSTNKVQKISVNEDRIQENMNTSVAESETMKGYRNIALFGVDARNGALGKGTRSDTTMIASINQDTGEVKLVSVYRDTFLNLSNDTYNKCNTAYAKGGPEQAIQMLNMNLDLNITDYVTVGFKGMVDTVDALGGVDIEVDESEISHLNNYQIGISEDLKRDYKPVTSTGMQRLDGMQATAYCRIRYTKGDDFKRAERQREVLQEIANKALQADTATLTKTASKILNSGAISTSLSPDEILEVVGNLKDYKIVGSDGFPFADSRTTATLGSKGDCVIPVTLESNVKKLHEFLFADSSYEPSPEVKEYSQKIKEQTAKYK